MDLWHVSITIHVIGFIWSILNLTYTIFREFYIRELTDRLMKNGEQSIQVSTSLTFTISELTKSIESDKNLSKQERAEFMRLVLDVEKRICDIVRDRTVANPTHVTVNDFNGDNAKVAQGQKVDQK